jgi:hypothetical protein
VGVRVALTAGGAVLENAHVRLELGEEQGRLVERISAASGGWEPVLVTSAPWGDPDLDLSPKLESVRVLRASDAEGALRIEGGEAHHFSVDVSLADGARFVHYRVQDDVGQESSLRSLQSRYRFQRERVDVCFTPHIRPREDQVIGQFNFKSPAVILQQGRTLAALVPDLALLGADAALLSCLEADVSPREGERPMLGYGFKDHEPHGLVYFRHRPERVARVGAGALVYGYYLYVSAESEPTYGYREIARLLWELFGRDGARSSSQVVPFDRYADYGLGYGLPNLWRDLPGGDEERGGMIMGIKFPNDIWFHFFFNHLHTAYWLTLLGRRRRDEDLVRRARKIRNLALSAPRREGLIPAIYSHEFVTGLRHDRWIPHAHWVGGSIHYQTQIPFPPDLPAYNTMDSAWTAYWMLRWYAELEADPRLLDAARALGEQLIRLQLPSGAIPVFVHAETFEPDDRLRESPSCAVAGLLLAQLYGVTRDERYLHAAQRVADFLAERVMPQGGSDYETYYDSAGKPWDLVDHYTQQRPQNTFGMYWTAELAKLLFRQTGQERYREQALRAVDYLLLFQAVWSPPYLSVRGFGSIGVGNGHTGWNDARSGIFAPGIADCYWLNGNVEYLQRGVAAMRAPLPLMYIPENQSVSAVYDKGPLGFADEAYAHRGRDARLGPSCFDFSFGYALGAFNELWPRLGSAYLDLEGRQGVGVDGCTVTALEVSGDRVEVQVRDEVAQGRPLTLRTGDSVTAPLHLSVNGRPAERYAEAELRRGIEIVP